MRLPGRIPQQVHVGVDDGIGRITGADLEIHGRLAAAVHELMGVAGTGGKPGAGAGHQHLYNRSLRDGVLYVITGGGGAPLHTFTEDYGGFMHYIVAKKRNGGYVFSVFDFKGTV